MMYIIVGLLLLFALNLAGFRPPGSRAFKLKNAACAAFLALAYCPSMQEFWRAFKYPDAFAEPTHVFNTFFPNAVYYIKFASACIGAVAVLVGFSLAHRKFQGVKRLYRLLPFLTVSSTASAIIGFYRRRSEVSVVDFVFILTFALCIWVPLFLAIRYFYKKNEELFFDHRPSSGVT